MIHYCTRGSGQQLADPTSIRDGYASISCELTIATSYVVPNAVG